MIKLGANAQFIIDKLKAKLLIIIAFLNLMTKDRENWAISKPTCNSLPNVGAKCKTTVKNKKFDHS